MTSTYKDAGFCPVYKLPVETHLQFQPVFSIDAMRFLVFLCLFSSAVLGREYLYGTPELQAAREAFFEEYQRLAKLDELAPDIHILFDDSPDQISIPETYPSSLNLGRTHRFSSPTQDSTPHGEPHQTPAPGAESPPQKRRRLG